MTSDIQENILIHSKRKLIQIVIIVGIGTFMSALDASIVNISLPTISNFFNVSLTTIEWVVLSYLLIITSLLLTFGRIGDIYGHKKIYNTGFLIFTLGSLFCALSSSIILLVSSRVLQAIGAGMLMAMGPAIITINCPAKDRGKYLGAIAVSVSVALISGPIAGGFLTSFFGWQSIFYINLPIGFIAFFWALKVLPSTRAKEIAAFDFVGAMILFFALSGIIFPLSFADKLGWGNILIISSLVVGIILLVTFFIIESRIKNPMLDLSLFKNKLFSMANISLMLNFVAQYTVTFIIPFYLIQLREFEPFKAGLILIANPIMVMIIAPLAGTISDKFDIKYLTPIGMTIASTGLFLLSTLKENSKIISIILYAAVVGLGIGLFQTPNNSTIMGSVPYNRRGIASSMIATMRNLGMILGVSISGSVFSARFKFLNNILSQQLNEVSMQSETLIQSNLNIDIKVLAFVGAFRFTLITAALISCIAIFTSLFLSFDKLKKNGLKNGKNNIFILPQSSNKDKVFL